MATRRFGTLLVVLALAGCGGEEQDQVEGTGYVFAVPDGWEEEDGEDIEVGTFRPDSLVVGEQRGRLRHQRERDPRGRRPRTVTAAQYAEGSLAGLRDPAGVGFPPEVAEMIENAEPEGDHASRATPSSTARRRSSGNTGARRADATSGYGRWRP